MKDPVEAVLIVFGLRIATEESIDGMLKSVPGLLLKEPLVFNCGGVPMTGKCVEPAAACSNLKEHVFEANLSSGVKSAGLEMTIKGSFNQMVTIGD